MSILNSTTPSEKFDHLGVYYRKKFLTEEEANFLSSYTALNQIEDNGYHSGFVKANFIKSRQEGWDQFKSIVSKVTTDMKSAYSTESIYVSMVKRMDVTNGNVHDESNFNSGYLLKENEASNGVIVKKFMLPTIDGWTATDAAQADPAWCIVVGLTTDDFAEGGEINVTVMKDLELITVSKKINSGDVIWFKGDVATEFSISGFVNEVTPLTTKSILDLTLTNDVKGPWSTLV